MTKDNLFEILWEEYAKRFTKEERYELDTFKGVCWDFYEQGFKDGSNSCLKPVPEQKQISDEDRKAITEIQKQTGEAFLICRDAWYNFKDIEKAVKHVKDMLRIPMTSGRLLGVPKM